LPEINTSTLLIYKKSIAVFIIVIFTVIHYLGLRVGSIVQNILTAIKIFIVMGLASVGLVLGGGDWSYLSSGVSQPLSLWSLGTAMMLVGFSYSGWNASAYIAGELRKPRKTLPISLLAGTGIVIFIFLMINVFIFQSAQYSELQNTIAVVKTAAVGSFGNWMGENLSFLIAVGLLSSLSAFIILGPRVYYAMAQDRLFFPFAAKVHIRYLVPGTSIIIQGTIAVVMVVIGSFEQLLVYIGFALGIFPWLAVVGVFIARKHKIGEESAFKVWGYPIVPLFFLFCSLVLMVFNYINRPLESTAAVVTVLAGIPCYYLWVRSVNKTNYKK
jgi:APA family basic amino acid/polyamine antiporter